MRRRPSFLVWAIGLLTACALDVASAQDNVGCERWSSDPPYEGYSPTGYKGGPERDGVWFSQVRAVKTAAGIRYRLKAVAQQAQSVLYDSVRPISLGAMKYGFIARRERCSVLVDRAGRALVPDRFDYVEEMESELALNGNGAKPAGVTLKMFASGPRGETWTVARFVNGTMVARAPHSYNKSYSLSHVMAKNKGSYRVPGYEVVNVQGKLGVLRYADLREVVEPIFDGVVRFPMRSGGREAWVVEVNSELALRSRNGDAIPASPFDDFELVAATSASAEYVALINKRDRSCRFYDLQFKPLIERDVPMGEDKCYGFDYQDGLLVVNDADGELQGIRLERDGRVTQAFHGGDGKVAARARNGILIVEGIGKGAARYRLLAPSGKALSDYDFDEFENIGCSFVRVKKGGVWYWPSLDGTLVENGFFPFSC